LTKINTMRIYWILATVCILLAACNGKDDKKETGGSGFRDTEFSKSFNLLNLKYHISDTALLTMKPGEKPLNLSGKNHFPDSLTVAFFGKGVKPKFYPLGKAINGDLEVYLVLKAVDGNRHAAFMLCYDGAMNYKDGLLLCASDDNPKTITSATMDKSFNIVMRNELFNSSEDIQVTEKSVIFNPEGFFMDVVNNDSEKKQVMQNPLDTLPGKGKFAGDYSAGEGNFISIRDGRDTGEIIFFYHFEKGEECNREIKDYAKINSKNSARFQKDGDPCVFSMAFNGNQLVLKEDEGCGNYRGLDCTLNGVFTKKKKTGSPADSAKEIPNAPPVKKPAVKTPPSAKKDQKTVTPVKKAPVKHDDVQ
jgi:hypothetical protein